MKAVGEEWQSYDLDYDLLPNLFCFADLIPFVMIRFPLSLLQFLSKPIYNYRPWRGISSHMRRAVPYVD